MNKITIETIENEKLALDKKLQKAILKEEVQGETAELFNSMQKLLNDALIKLATQERVLENEEEIRQNVEQIIIENNNSSTKLNGEDSTALTPEQKEKLQRYERITEFLKIGEEYLQNNCSELEEELENDDFNELIAKRNDLEIAKIDVARLEETLARSGKRFQKLIDDTVDENKMWIKKYHDAVKEHNSTKRELNRLKLELKLEKKLKMKLQDEASNAQIEATTLPH